ncbi:hypothetical protein NZD89_08865 [Alicyclobacillus fastidiosus]|uniref:Pectate lyase superfamily protein domain-containing protein n=1 Tax=Alicyclobacillus fastidiosus TaxID=392011 RepID=A0ABY6ZNE7_9BACL|nr:hypothetical protein [Alicyclobacillus fastidiosus]WAH43475.1 hypothetical protein NZD89_08865 [Alicyclobacillus fastidiosus]GMA59634.1 hypothetical protein GCM10025859_00740 [Alicyclobacillus fastidiosus]
MSDVSFGGRSDWIDIRNYQTPSVNGVQDDTQAFATAAYMANGKAIQLSPGTYYVQNIQLISGLVIRGSGRNATTIVHTGSGKAISNNTGTSIGNIELADFTLICNPHSTIGIEFSMVYQSIASRINILQSNGGNTNFTGVSFDHGDTGTSYYNTMTDVSVNAGSTNTIGTGYLFQNKANSNRLIGCRTNAVTTAVQIAKSTTDHIVVIGCTFEQFTNGIIDNGYRNVFVGNRFENSGSASGTGIILSSTTTNALMAGNQYINLTTAFTNGNMSGANMIMDHSQLNAKYISHDSGGGWNSVMNMRNYGIQSAGYLGLSTFPSSRAPSNSIFVNSADNKLYFKDSAGVLTALTL